MYILMIYKITSTTFKNVAKIQKMTNCHYSFIAFFVMLPLSVEIFTK